MVVWRFGFDYTDTPCMKIMKGTFNPRTTPDADREKFFFSSKWPNIAAPGSIQFTDWVGNTSQVVYTPSGSNDSNFQRKFVSEGGNINYHFLRNSLFSGLRYNMPLIAVAWKSRSTQRFTQSRVQDYQRNPSNPNGAYGGYYVGGMGEELGWMRNMRASTYLTTPVPYGTSQVIWNNASGQLDNNVNKRVIVFNLPGDDTPLDGPALPPPSSSGKMLGQITSAQCRVAKPGYDVRTATPAQLAFDANNRAVRCIAARDVAVPAGASAVDLGVDLPAEVVALVHFYEGSTIVYPSSPKDEDFGADYWFSGTTINFNANSSCRARFIVFAFDNTPPTSGSNRVIRKFTEGSVNHLQLLRPGASANPSFADIVLDTRWPVVQILKEDYISVGNGDLQHQISYDATGFFPFIIYCTHHGSGSERKVLTFSWDERVRPPFTKIVRQTGGNHGGDSTRVAYNASGATFYTYKGRPVSSQWSNNDGWQFDNDPSPIIGLRYYVLGIPV
ncbi:MAG: hypothetical protein QHC90_25960 [Shinella sp.]|nr:hypothetical protein [Shinella sp.]